MNTSFDGVVGTGTTGTGVFLVDPFFGPGLRRM